MAKTRAVEYEPPVSGGSFLSLAGGIVYHETIDGKGIDGVVSL